MPLALIVGPAAALLGIVAVFFVLRRKSVDKRSMYSARRSQIEHKVRAARQRTLTPHGRPESPADATAAPPAPGAAPFAATQVPTAIYEPSAYQPPPAAAPTVGQTPPEAPSTSPWDMGPVMSPPPGQFESPAPPPSFEPTPNAEVWIPAPAPAPAEIPFEPPPPAQVPFEPATPAEPARPAMTPASPAAWSVVGESKQSAMPEPEPKKKKGRDQEAAPAGSWQLASGDAPGMGSGGDEADKAPGQAVAIAQYAVLVVGLVAVLIGVLIMVAGSPVK